MHAPRVWAEVDLRALRCNLAAVRARVGPRVAVMAVVKADAYGHGAAPVARALEEAGVERLGVGDSSEALALREAGITIPILVLGALVDRELDDVIEANVTPTIHSQERVKDLDRRARAQGRRVAVHLMVDTGMGRLGVKPENAPRLMEAIAEAKNLLLEGVATHFPSAPDPDPSFTREQIAVFRGILADAAGRGLRCPIAHAANSAGLFGHAESHFEMVRPGAALYGIDPGNVARAGVRLRPVLAWRTQIVFLKRVEKGTPIGYGSRYRAPRATQIATVPVGYHDGYPYQAANRADVLVRGRRARVVGTVTMDYLTVDVGDRPGPRVGDTVTLVGEDGDEAVPAQELAAHAGTIPYAVTSLLGRRVRRRYVGGAHAGPVEAALLRPLAQAARARREPACAPGPATGAGR